MYLIWQAKQRDQVEKIEKELDFIPVNNGCL